MVKLLLLSGALYRCFLAIKVPTDGGKEVKRPCTSVFDVMQPAIQR